LTAESVNPQLRRSVEREFPAGFCYRWSIAPGPLGHDVAAILMAILLNRGATQTMVIALLVLFNGPFPPCLVSAARLLGYSASGIGGSGALGPSGRPMSSDATDIIR
jgi:hypothetical protein